MNDIAEICMTCQHYRYPECLVWKETQWSGSCCHLWEVRQTLLPTVEGIQKIYRANRIELNIPAHDPKL